MKKAIVIAAVSLIAACASNDDSDGAKLREGEASSNLSAAFTNLCSTCHGPEGRGKDANPPIPGTKDKSAFISQVRTGKRTMPAFDKTLISDAELEADYLWLTTERK